MNSEHKMFLKVCGSVLAIVAIAIFLSFGTGDSYAATRYDYEYNITYVLYGGEMGEHGDTIVSGDTITVIDNPTKVFTVIGDARHITGATVGEPTTKELRFKGWAAEDISASAKTGTTFNEDDLVPWDGSWTTNRFFYNIVYKDEEVRMIAGWEPTEMSLPTISKENSVCYWSEDETVTASSRLYESGGLWTTPDSPPDDSTSITMYAYCVDSVAEPNSYTITYYANNGTNDTRTQSKEEGTSVTISRSYFSRENYVFVNWNTKADGTGTTYNPGATYSANANLKLYAQWVANQYTITYNANEGTGAPSSQTKTYGVNLTLSDDIPTREGYEFVSWNTKADGTGTSYLPSSNYSKDANVTLYAQWIEENIEMYNILYIVDEGDTDWRMIYGYPVGEDAYISDVDGEKEGYTFDEWNTKKDGSGKTYKPGDKYTKGEDLILYAIWNKNKEKTDDEPVQVQTGNALILVALVTGLAALCYALLYVKKMKSNN